MPDDVVLAALRSQNTKAIVGLVAVAFVTGGLWMKLQTDVSAIKESVKDSKGYSEMVARHEWMVLDHEKRIQYLESKRP